MIRRHKQVDYVLFAAIGFLIVFGFVMLASASSDLGKIQFNDAYYYIKHQLFFGFSLGVIGFIVGYLLPYHFYKKVAPFLLLSNIVALFLVFTPLGFAVGGAYRWLRIGPMTIQPLEMLKISFVLYLAAWLANMQKKRNHSVFEGFIPFLAIVGVIGFLLLLQKSTSAVIILMPTALAIYFIAGARWKYIFATIGMGLLVLSIIICITPYRRERIMTFFDPNKDTAGSGYQINQSLMTIGSGGLWGVGYGNSFSKSYLPERIGDFIFAVVAEEFGFVGSMFILGIFLLVILRGYLIAKHTDDNFTRLILVGFSTILAIQVFVHVGANSGLIPLTGVPLPFVSYGGTALAVFMTMGGIMLNISKSA
ncbi:MAG: putative peptidoglycan glycosyltransferase FtsW [bacterium]